MITGFNTDIEHDGVVYHVQTEDKGLETPIILSLVYTGGTILASKRSPYQDLIAEGYSDLTAAGTLKVLACVDLSNTICKVLGAGYREPRETLDLVDHPALSFLDIPTETAPKLVAELQEAFAKEAAYWVH